MNNFYAIISRMKYIFRWGLMRNVTQENLLEHSHQTAILAHALATIENERCGGSVNADKAAVLALYHDSAEIITGDLPTPIKNLSPELSKSYDKAEQTAYKLLLSRLPEDLRGSYAKILDYKKDELYPYVKAADLLSAYIKCIQELDAGNKEFKTAKESLGKKLEAFPLPSLKIFMEEFLPSFVQTLDQQ